MIWGKIYKCDPEEWICIRTSGARVDYKKVIYTKANVDSILIYREIKKVNLSI